MLTGLNFITIFREYFCMFPVACLAKKEQMRFSLDVNFSRNFVVRPNEHLKLWPLTKYTSKYRHWFTHFRGSFLDNSGNAQSRLAFSKSYTHLHSDLFTFTRFILTYLVLQSFRGIGDSSVPTEAILQCS